MLPPLCPRQGPAPALRPALLRPVGLLWATGQGRGNQGQHSVSKNLNLTQLGLVKASDVWYLDTITAICGTLLGRSLNLHRDGAGCNEESYKSRQMTETHSLDPRDERRVVELEKELATLRQEFNNYVKEKEKEESRKIRTALLWAGAVIIALASFIWSEIMWPIIKSGSQRP